MKTERIVQLLDQARRCSVPLVAIGTADQWALAKIVLKTLPGDVPKVSWDYVRGVRALDATGEKALKAIAGGKALEEFAIETIAPQAALEVGLKLPKDSVFVMFNAHLYFTGAEVRQGISNLRDPYKKDGRMLIMTAPGFTMPAEIARDVVVLDEDLPTDEALKKLCYSIHNDAKLKAPTEEVATKAVDAARGLSMFEAEQVFAMSLTTEGIDLDGAWDRKRAAINQTKGLSITKNGMTFDDLGGLENGRTYMNRRFNGNSTPRAILFMDELEKSLAGASGSFQDSSGVSQDALGEILRNMEDNGWDGLIAVGPPGSGKTAFARAVGNEHGVPTITMDLGAMKGSLVGESEAAIRNAMRVVRGVAGERVFVVATCNKLDVLPPELRRRFRSGIWFFDLPSDEERAAIWKINRKKFSLKEQELPNDLHWTGAEIRNCCEQAYMLACTLKEAAQFIVPVASADPDSIERLRALAHMRFLSASKTGLYVKEAEALAGARKFDLEPGRPIAMVALFQQPEGGVVGGEPKAEDKKKGN
jgi:hypothetical protein